MEYTYLVITLAILLSSITTGFITFRMIGMRLAVHFGFLMLAFIATIAAIATGLTTTVLAAAVLQILATITAYTQIWPTLKYSIQTSPGYAPHLALMTMLPVLALAAVLM
ncbi:conserved hypothetical protein [Methanolacinia petrolearia DSM 11571]|uniref:Uncharacterized protein n=1 Tax=Methanolacinia petrolearia (strain DSM 11571 / OCM 486 / SEBR 4847) TaxID=679926 RepID=E1RGJ6_METP4|nr:DUF5400 domain-containing protein [Methanolacinia petrolearia]ADN35207.1 conserved hypothetical protein [Methanolacinia petrolearia DSM 11571]